jgi:hypothetical protein
LPGSRKPVPIKIQDWVDEGPRAGTERRLPERVFWDNAERSRSFWLRNAKANGKDVAVYIAAPHPPSATPV